MCTPDHHPAVLLPCARNDDVPPSLHDAKIKALAMWELLEDLLWEEADDAIDEAFE